MTNCLAQSPAKFTDSSVEVVGELVRLGPGTVRRAG